MGASWQNTILKGELIYQKVAIDKKFENILPVLRFNYNFTNFKRLSLDYETSMQEPTIQELQPVVNNNDPLNLVAGNPNLGPGYSHSVRGNFTLFDPGTFINVFSFLTATYTSNAISTSQVVNADLVRATIPVNVRYNYNIDGTLHFGFPLKQIKSRVGLRASVVENNGITLLNNVENYIRRQTLGAMATYSYSLDEIFNLDLSASLQQQKSRYDFNTADQLFVNGAYQAEASLRFLKNYQLYSKFNFLDYRSETTGFSQTIPLWDVAVSRFLLKNNSGELKLGVSNLLDKNVSITQTTSTNYLEQRASNNLGRYFMLSFIYALNKQLSPSFNMKGHFIRR